MERETWLHTFDFTHCLPVVLLASSLPPLALLAILDDLRRALARARMLLPMGALGCWIQAGHSAGAERDV